MNPNDTQPKEPTPEENAELQTIENDTPSPEEAGPVEAPTDTFGKNNDSSTTQDGEPTQNPTPIGGPAIVPQQKKSKKIIVIIAATLLLAGLTTVGYFVWQSLQPAAAPAATETSNESTNTNDAESTPLESAADIESEVDTIQEEIDALTDDDFSVEPISDASLNAQE